MKKTKQKENKKIIYKLYLKIIINNNKYVKQLMMN